MKNTGWLNNLKVGVERMDREYMNSGTVDPEVPALEVRNLHKSYGSLEVLRGVSFQVRRGEKFAFIGSSGSGKSTLLRCINMLEEYDDGHVKLFGKPVGYKTVDGKRTRASSMGVSLLRQRIGMVFQSYNLFPHMTVIQNICEGPITVKHEPHILVGERARQLLAKVGLEDKADSYPGQLSGGQQQRVAIARALAMEPEVMLFDEVTSALDPELTAEVLRVMEQLAKEGMTMLIVSHEMDFARRVADQVVFLSNGVIVESGPPDVVLGRPSTPELARFLSQLN